MNFLGTMLHEIPGSITKNEWYFMISQVVLMIDTNQIGK